MDLSTLFERKADVLHLKHVDVDVSFVLEHSYAKEGDIVLVAGTLVEGIGNPCSDIDVYVITDSLRKRADIDPTKHHRVLSPDRSIIREDSDPNCDVYLVHTVVPHTSIKVDVEFKTFAEVTQAFSAVHDIFDYAVQNLFLLTKRLNEREEAMVHRFYNCITIMGEERFSSLLGQLSLEKFLYVGYRWTASDFNILLDLIGAWKVGEIDRAVEFARENVIIQTGAYLRVAGHTNYRRKWLLTYLRRFADPHLLAEYSELTFLEGVYTLESKIAYVHRALDYVDRLFSLSRPYLTALPGVPSGQEALELLWRDRERTPLANDYGMWEFHYRAKAYRDDPAPTRELLGPIGSGAP